MAGADAADNDITGRHGNSQPKPKPPTDSSSRELSADTTSRITIAAAEGPVRSIGILDDRGALVQADYRGSQVSQPRLPRRASPAHDLGSVGASSNGRFSLNSLTRGQAFFRRSPSCLGWTRACLGSGLELKLALRYFQWTLRMFTIYGSG